MNLSRETIIAPITPNGVGAVFVLRISGERVEEIVKKICSKADKVLASPSKQILADLLDTSKEKKTVIDSSLFTYFKAPRSFTGEDVLEISIHGSRFVKERLISNVISLGARLANGGEFSERAFLNGKIDLTQAEAIGDLIASQSEQQALLANQALSGKLSSIISDFGEPLRDLLAEIEANIDFPEEDINPLESSKWKTELEKCICNLDSFIDSFKVGRVFREGLSIVLCGAPNAGKSSLLNALLEEERAIVTDIAGTTRDSIEESLSIDGVLVRLFDTAGLADEKEREIDIVEQAGILRSKSLAKNADIVVFLFDASSDISKQEGVFMEFSSLLSGLDSKIIKVLNKEDQVSAEEKELAIKKLLIDVSISAKKSLGLDELKKEILNLLFRDLSQMSLESPILSNQRHKMLLEDSKKFLHSGLEAIQNKLPAEIIALEIRAALIELNEIIGVTENEDILGRIFSKFCIGK